MYKIIIPEKVNAILECLEGEGFQAFVVGGSVRDSLMGRKPNDWDICTSARPKQTELALRGCSIVRKIVETGIEHGTITAVCGGDNYEITTFRTDGSYSDGRHPDSVEFRQDVKDDLARRDFTINAMAYSRDRGLIDPYGGEADLEAGIIRCVGEPELRFSEDALRIMRALRFAAKLGFSIDGETEEAMRELAPSVERVASERVSAELTGLLLSDHAGETIRKYHRVIYEALGLRIADKKSLYAMDKARRELPIRLNILFPYDTENCLRALRLSNRVISDTLAVKKLASMKAPVTKSDVLHLMHAAAEMTNKNRAGAMAERSLALREAYGERFQTQIQLIRECALNECYSVEMLAVSGKDLIEAGISPGKLVGIILNSLLDLVMDGKLSNVRKDLMNFVFENILMIYGD
ncbi:MAG: hypothetical protein PUB39_06215 [Eubacteriales bacterium]|nr:hypothetical protein [Eubacteriales bacterium]